jgi:hypothetical protein
MGRQFAQRAIEDPAESANRGAQVGPLSLGKMLGVIKAGQDVAERWRIGGRKSVAWQVS